MGLTVLGFLVTGYAQQPLLDLPYVPTPQEVVLEMLRMAEVTKDDIVYDLGCGDGRIVITAARLFGARGVGVDNDPDRVKESIENARKAGVADRVAFFEKDLFQTDISKATVVALYLLPELNLHLRPRLFGQLKPGTRIVSHEFGMGDWKPDKTALVRDARFYYDRGLSHVRDARILYWLMPADVAGVWRWSVITPTGERSYAIRLDQKFQDVSGKVNAGVKEVVLNDARLSGEQLSFTVREEIDQQDVMTGFSGRVRGDTIEGRAEVQGRAFAGTHPWTAKRIH